MEESVSLKEFLSYYKKAMNLQPVDADGYSPLILAYIGDAVYEVMIRMRVINKGSMPMNRIHRKTASLVKAGAQAKMLRALEEELTEEELAVYRRGRNAKSPTMAKHATMIDYRTSTGMEALVGWLFLREDFERLTELVSRGLGLLGEMDEEKETHHAV
mgnify:FL=1